MGVPSYFRELLKKYPSILSRTIDRKVSALYIDANCLFHPQCFKILDLHKNLSGEKLFKKMADRITEYIDQLIDRTNPQDLVYIAVDGTAPLAKINQQRYRRFGSANNYKHRIYRKYGIPFNNQWSNVVITPGTEFMHRLHLHIKQYYEKCKFKCSIIYSSYLTVGEGEHKILQHMKKLYGRSAPKKNGSIVVYGLDADLIFLTLASQINDIYLMRESDIMDGRETADDSVEQPMKYVSMDRVKQSIDNDFRESINRSEKNNSAPSFFGSDDNNHPRNESKHLSDLDNITFVNDYILICYFLGNDFIPQLPSIDIRTHGLDQMIACYLDTFQRFGYPMVQSIDQKVVIDHIFFKEFILLLSNQEEGFYKESLPSQIYKHRKKRCMESIPYKREIWEIENLKDIKQSDPCDLLLRGNSSQLNEIKYKYYEHHMHTNRYMNETKEDMTRCYLEGVIWVAKYYFEKCVAWKWHYRYSVAPFLTDIYQMLKKYPLMSFDSIPQSNPVDMYVHLVAVIPPSFSHVLPPALQILSTSDDSPIIDMYPTDHKLDTTYKQVLYKCHPIIPPIEIERVEEAVHRIKLDKQSIVYSTRCDDFRLK